MKTAWMTGLVGVFLVACATVSTKMNDLELGMNEREVKRVLGEPRSTKAKGNEKVLVYWDTNEYWVVLQDGKVAYYGAAGDYDSAAAQKVKLKIE